MSGGLEGLSDTWKKSDRPPSHEANLDEGASESEVPPLTDSSERQCFSASPLEGGPPRRAGQPAGSPRGAGAS